MPEHQEETPADTVTTRIGQAVMLHTGGDREEARNRLAGLWKEADAGAAPLQRCTIAHYMADTQDDPADELVWDLCALEAAQSLTEDHVSWGEDAVAVRTLYPSLHLNIAADHAKLGDTPAAHRALDRARRAAAELADDEYGRGIRAAINRLAARVGGPGQFP